MSQLFRIDQRVTFENDHGQQSGTVRSLFRSIDNGQSFATVEVDHILPGIMESVPLDHLRAEVTA